MIEYVAVLAPFLMVCFLVWNKNQRRLAEMQMQYGRDELREGEGYARLEERIQVLERIVTDRGYDLAAQIEALRHDQPAPRPELTSRSTTPVA